MAQLAVWMVVCFAVALTLQKRPVLVLAVVLAIRVLVPSTGGWVLIGNWAGNAAIHPATLLLLTWAPFFILGNISAVAAEVRRHRFIHGLLVLSVTLFLVVALVMSGPTSLIGLTNSVVGSVLFFFCARIAETSRPGAMSVLVKVLICLTAVESLLVIAQWLMGNLLPWGAIVQFTLATRPLGTFDSPLDLGLAVALVIPLLVSIRSATLRYVCALLLVVAVVLSESRTPTILAVVGLAYLILSSMKSIRSLVAMLVVLGIGAAVVTSLPILGGLAERFTGDDGNSSAARSVATDYIFQNITSVVLFGNGWGSSYQLKGTLLETSLENGYAILAFDLGGISVLILLVAQLLIALGRRGRPGAWLGALFAIAGGFTYSGITTMSAISIVMWAVLAARLSPVSVNSPAPLKDESRASDIAMSAAKKY